MGNGQDCCSTTFMPSTLSSVPCSTNPSALAPFRLSSKRRWLAADTLPDRRTAAKKAHRWVRHVFGRGRCGGGAPAQGRPLAAAPPKYASTTGDACEMSCAMVRPPVFQVANWVSTRLNYRRESRKFGSISVANAPELVQRRAILLGIDLFSLQMAVSLPDNTLEYGTPPAEKLVSRGAQEVNIVYIVQK